MPSTTAPLLSFDARGQIGKTMVYSSWKGKPYVRRYVTPANPQSVEQTITRNAFSFIQATFKLAPPLFTAPWEAYIKGKPLTSRNAFTKFNLPVLRGEADMNNFIGSPGALGGLAPTAIVATNGVGTSNVTLTAPATVPTGWTIQGGVAAAIKDQDPDSGTLFTIVAAEDLVTPYVVVLPGLTAGLYRVVGWFRWTRDDGLTAYSPSISTTCTPT